MNIKTAMQKGIQLTNRSFDILAILMPLSLCSFFGMWYFLSELYKPTNSTSSTLALECIAFLASTIIVTLFLLGATLNYIYHKAKFGNASLSEFTSGGQKFFWRMLKFFSISTLIIVCLPLALVFLFSAISEFSLITASLICIILLFYALKICARFFLLVPCILVANNDSLSSAHSKSKKISNRHLFCFMMLLTFFIILPQVAGGLLQYFIISSNLHSFLNTSEALLNGLLLFPLSTYIYVALGATTIEYYLSITPQSTTTDAQNLATT